MHYRTIGDIRIPVIGLGTWDLRGAECARTVSFALQNGYSHVDTARYYANEVAVGEGIRGSGVARPDVFLTTKVWWDQLSEQALLASAKASLRDLGTDYVDLLLVHWPNPAIPLAETIGGLLKAKEAGLTRAIGVSNFPSQMMREAQALAGGALVTNQVEYHPLISQKAVLGACAELGMTLTAFSPLAQGKARSHPDISELARERRIDPSRLILRWLIQQDRVIAIPKSATPKNLLSNIDLFDFELSESEMAFMNGLDSPDGRQVRASWEPKWD